MYIHLIKNISVSENSSKCLCISKFLRYLKISLSQNLEIFKLSSYLGISKFLKYLKISLSQNLEIFKLS